MSKQKNPQHFTSIQRNLFLRHTMWLVLVYRQSLRGEQIHILDSANNPTIDDLAICLHCFRKQQNTITHEERSKSLSYFLPWYIITKLKHPFKPWIKKKLKISKPWKKNNHSKHQIIIIGKILHCMVNISMLG